MRASRAADAASGHSIVVLVAYAVTGAFAQPRGVEASAMTWLRRWAEELIPMFLVAGLLALGYAAYALAAARTHQNEQQNQYHHIKE